MFNPLLMFKSFPIFQPATGLCNMGLRFEVVPSWFKETLDKSSFKMPYDYAKETAKEKALEVAKRMHLKHLKTPDIVIGADTIVSIDGDILEKPVDKQAAHTMLSRLSNKEHSVFTGVAIVQCHCTNDNQLETKISAFYEETKVKFSDLSEELLWEYIHSGEPMDKAGGYGIQALGGMLVEYVHGDFLNVVGFPLNHFCKKLGEIYNPPITQCIANYSIPSWEGLGDRQHDPVNQEENGTAEKKLKSSQTAASKEVINNPSTKQPNSISEAMGSAELHRLPSASILTETNAEWLHKITDLVDGFKASKVLFTASKLKVFDALNTQDGLEASEVARRLEATVDGTECLLDACVSLNLLKKSPGTSQAYKNTQLASTYLVSGNENAMHDYIIYANNHIWPLFTHLDSAVKEGACRNEAKDLFQNSEQTRSLMSAINCLVKVTGNDIVMAFDLSSFKTACDLGGCTGVLTHEIANAYQDMTLIVFNLPQMLEKVKYSQSQSQNLHQIFFREGDLFTDDLPEADLYILLNTLHYWKEDKVDFLLGRLSQKCKPGCGLLLAELVLYDWKTKSSRAVLQSLNMFVQSKGKERSGSEYRKLLHKHGFTNVQIKCTGSFLDVILCIKQ
ncbi:probable bifunctional dTTP/UTP pyrophosphatase/methyltransferase protein isoform X2 [Heterodontus francisci]|uniref:probable bifunctional dTTP/UTP pyrophosphatase/methyltransferase protein isoform X2 n=1 Tax=Heterodontus francisci TaxID=7792 RepID=UPI00355C9883